MCSGRKKKIQGKKTHKNTRPPEGSKHICILKKKLGFFPFLIENYFITLFTEGQGKKSPDFYEVTDLKDCSLF